MPDSTSGPPAATSAKIFLLRTPRLLIRPWTPADAEAALAIYGDARVMRYLGSAGASGGSVPVPDLETMRQRMGRWIEQPADPHGLPGLLAIVEKESGQPIGSILLKRLPDGAGNPTADVEVGWHLRPDRWGRGHATEAARAMIAYAFEILRLREVHAVVYKDNVASIRVCERLGMTHLGETDRYYGVKIEHFRLMNHEDTKARRHEAETLGDRKGSDRRTRCNGFGIQNHFFALRVFVPSWLTNLENDNGVYS